MIQFNLLPDVKLAFIKAERLKRLVISISILASAVALVVFVLLFLTVNVAQKKNINDLTRDISSQTSKIKSTGDLDKVLTVQGQLNSLTALHDQKPIASRLYGYINQVTPSTITISNTSVDFTANTITLSGAAPSLDVVNTYVDTLKFTQFTTDSTTTPQYAFKDVVLTSFSRSLSNATYSISFSFDPLIFNATNKTTLIVPQTVTTRSVTEQPSIFKKDEKK